MTFNKVYRDAQEPSISLSNPIDNINISLWKANTEIAASNSPINNVEVIEYVVPLDGGGNYHCEINAGDMYSVNVPQSVSYMKWRPGDMNNDNIVSTLDYVYVSLLINGNIQLIGEKEFIADVNNDGVIDNDDLTLISAYISS